MFPVDIDNKVGSGEIIRRYREGELWQAEHVNEESVLK